ncbi:MAG: 4-hydroxy-tetrahydrodipicolinate reductase [Phycisphaeraceae bacterium]
MATTIAINGAAGRMGRRLVALAAEDADLEVTAALEAPGHALSGQDAGTLSGAQALGVAIGSTLQAGAAQAMIDFTAPPGFRAAIKTCLEHAASGKPVALVVGTTGLSAEDHARIDEAAKVMPVLQAANMSLGVNLLLGLAAQVAQRLGDDYDIEIVETHHRFKVDAPSGTALAIAQAVCEATGKSMEKDLVHGRHGGDELRQRGQIGMHALRSGDIVGKHTISFGTQGEELAITHTATNRDVFARGALKAAKWLTGKPAGRYSMKDVLGL